MRILVTGFSGFVGQYLCQELVKRGHEVYGVARHRVKMTSVPGENQLFIDMRRSGELIAAFLTAKPESVVHLAAQASVAESWHQPATILREALEMTFSLILAVNSTPSIKYVVNVGSGEQYRPPDTARPLSEEDPLYPLSPYGLSKTIQEVLLQQFLGGKINLLRFRVFNLTGPGQSRRYVVASFADQIAKIKAGLSAPQLHTGDLTKIRDFLDVRDASQVLASAAEGEIPAGVYNLCSGTGRKLVEIVDMLSNIAGVKTEIVMENSLQRPKDADYLVGSPMLLKKRLRGFMPRDLAATLYDMLCSCYGRLR